MWGGGGGVGAQMHPHSSRHPPLWFPLCKHVIYTLVHCKPVQRHATPLGHDYGLPQTLMNHTPCTENGPSWTIHGNTSSLSVMGTETFNAQPTHHVTGATQTLCSTVQTRPTYRQLNSCCVPMGACTHPKTTDVER